MKYTAHQLLWSKTKEVCLTTLIPLLMATLSVLTACSGDSLDTIKLNNRGAGETALWVTQTVNDSIRDTLLTGNTSNFTGTFTGAPGAIIVYSDKRPPSLEPVDWSDGIDTVTMRLDNIHRIGLSIWIVHGDYNTIKKRAIEAKRMTSEIWLDERQGIAFKNFRFHNETAKKDSLEKSVPEKFGSRSFDCGSAAALMDPIDGIGFTENVINVYYIETVNVYGQDLSTGSVYCQSDNLIALGVDSKKDLLAHELGHAFALEHVDGQHLESYFDKTNVMHPWSDERRFLTEGQTYRAVANEGSAINSLYNTGANPIVVNCLTEVQLRESYCPPIQKRIWQDGGEDGKTWGPE
jgi:hypothetical protein